MNKHQEVLRDSASLLRGDDSLDGHTRALAATALETLALLHGMFSDEPFNADLYERVASVLGHQGFGLYGMDEELAAADLKEKYTDRSGGGEHPRFVKLQWKYEAAQNRTLLGYWEWVARALADIDQPQNQFI